MDTNFDKRIQELLSNHVEQPSLDCWDKISSNLDALQAIHASSATSANASQFSQFVGSVVGKIAVTATIVAGVAVATYFIVGNHDENSQTVQTQEISTTEQYTDAAPVQYAEEELVENDAKNVFCSDKITQTNSRFSADTTIENGNVAEENINVFSPISTIPAKSSDLNVAAKESSVQPQETEPQQHFLPTKKEKEAVTEPTKATTPIVETKEEEPEEFKQPKIGIPNVITPNGDGVNDFFVFINIEQVEDNQLDIYTREGKVVYSKRFYDNSWDGRGLPDGTYFYVFRFTYEGNQFLRKGSISIIR